MSAQQPTPHCSNIFKRSAFFPAMADRDTTQPGYERAPSPDPRVPSQTFIRLRTMLTPVFLALLKFFLQAATFIIVSKSIHQLVRCMDSIYDATGRRSRTRFESVPWFRILLGVLLLVGWHVWLARLSVQVVGEKEEGGLKNEEEKEEIEKSEKAVTWGRILGKLLVPAFLVCSGAILALKLTGRLFFQEIGQKEEGLS